MGDQLRWWKLWTSALGDPSLEALTLEDWARWARLGALTTTHGDHGRYHACYPARALVATLRVGGHEGSSRHGSAWCWKTLLATLRRLPGLVVVEDGSGKSRSLTITWTNWRKYQEDSSTQRMRTWRANQRARDGQQASRGDGQHTVTSRDTCDGLPASQVTVQTRRDETVPSLKGSPSTDRHQSPWPDHPHHLDRKLAAFEAGYHDSLATCPDPLAFRRQVVEAAETWPGRELPPKATLLWFRDGAWHPGEA